jgi:hypothetical protein
MIRHAISILLVFCFLPLPNTEELTGLIGPVHCLSEDYSEPIVFGHSRDFSSVSQHLPSGQSEESLILCISEMELREVEGKDGEGKETVDYAWVLDPVNCSVIRSIWVRRAMERCSTLLTPDSGIRILRC